MPGDHRQPRQTRRVRHVIQAIERFGGLACRWQLRAFGVSADEIDVAAHYGRHVIRVRKGWYARADENRDVIRACRREPLRPDSPVVVHWTRHPGPGDSRAVTAAHAEAVAAACGVHAAGVPARRPRAQAAASSESASRIV